MLFKNILLGLGGTGIVGGAGVGIYYGIKGEEKSTTDDGNLVSPSVSEGESGPKSQSEDKGEEQKDTNKDTNGKSGDGDNSAVSSDTDKEKQQ